MQSYMLRAAVRTQRIITCGQMSGSWRPISVDGKAEDVKKKQEDKQSQSGPLAATGTEKKKSQAELDKELREKMQSIAGDGGDAGLELEDGKPVSMKRGVRENMFRYI